MRLRGGGESEHEDESEYEEGEDEDEVELGRLRSMPDEWDIDSALGKVGGLPTWLDPASPLEHHHVACAVCHDSMSLLLQVSPRLDTQTLINAHLVPHRAAQLARRPPTTRRRAHPLRLRLSPQGLQIDPTGQDDQGLARTDAVPERLLPAHARVAGTTESARCARPSASIQCAR